MTTDPTPNHGPGCTIGQPYGECAPACGIQPYQWRLLESAQIYVDEFGKQWVEPSLKQAETYERAWTATHEDVYKWAEKLPYSFKKKRPTEQFIDMLKRLRDEEATYNRILDEAVDALS
jgi:hypothetical protein